MDLSLALNKIFPLTFSLLTRVEAEFLTAEFEKDWELEQIHYFPMLVRHKNMSPRIVEAADYEYLKNWVKSQTDPIRASTHLKLNPQLQFVWIEEAADALRKEPGLYALWKWKEKFFEMKLSREEALVLDRLREDVVLTRQELGADQDSVLNHLISLKIVLDELKELDLNS